MKIRLRGKTVAAALAVGMVGCHACPRPSTGGEPAPTGVAYSTITVNCSSLNSYTLTTGNNQGHCSTTTDDHGTVTGGACDDGKGNTAAATCAGNNGDGRCTSTSGAGNCSTKRKRGDGDATGTVAPAP